MHVLIVISRAAVFPRIRIKAEKPSVDRVELSTDMITATRAYEANVTVINSAKGMATAALNIGKS